MAAPFERGLAGGGCERLGTDWRYVVHPRHRGPQVRAWHGGHAVEVRRRDTDDLIRLRPDTQAPAHDGRIPSEGPFPQSARDHGHARGGRMIVLRRQQPAEHRLHAEKLKVVAGHRLAHHEVDFLAHPRHRKHRGMRGHIREHVVLRAEIEIVRIGVAHVPVETGLARVDVDELPRTKRSSDCQKKSERSF